MKKDYLRLDDVVKIHSYYKKKPEFRIWKPKTIFRPEGVYSIGFPMDNLESLKETEVVINGVLYLKPHIEFVQTNGSTIKKYFESKAEMEKYIKRFLDSNWIEVN